MSIRKRWYEQGAAATGLAAFVVACGCVAALAGEVKREVPRLPAVNSPVAPAGLPGATHLPADTSHGAAVIPALTPAQSEGAAAAPQADRTALAVRPNLADPASGSKRAFSAPATPAPAGVAAVAAALPQATIQFLNEEGPLFHLRVGIGDGASQLDTLDTLRGLYDGVDFKGKTPVYILVGTGYGALNRPWIDDWVMEAVEEIGQREIPGLRLLVVDKPEDLQAAFAGHYALGAGVKGDPSDPELKAVAKQVVDYAEANNLLVVGGSSFLSPFILNAAALQEHVRDSGHNPMIPVNPVEAVRAARIKSVTRQLAAAYRPQSAVPADVVDGPLEGESREQTSRRVLEVARRMFEQNPGSRFVMKPEQGAGKLAIRSDVATPEQAVETFWSILGEFANFWNKPANAHKRDAYTAQENPRIVIERQIEAQGEYDDELVFRRVSEAVFEAVAFVIGNPPPVGRAKSEIGQTFPAMVSHELARQLITGAVLDQLALWLPHGALPIGNSHIERFLEFIDKHIDALWQDWLIEVNATRPVGGAHGVPVVKEWSGWDLIKLAVRANLGLPLNPPLDSSGQLKQPESSMVIRKLTPAFTGTIDKIVIPEGLQKTPGLMKLVTSNVGDAVYTPDDLLYSFSSIGYVLTRGETPERATRLALDIMRRIEVWVRTPSGSIEKQRGDAFHREGDEARLQ